MSLSAAESGPRTSKMTIMLFALSVLQTAALCYTRFQGPCSEKSRHDHVKGVHSTFRHQTLFKGSLPVLPPRPAVATSSRPPRAPTGGTASSRRSLLSFNCGARRRSAGRAATGRPRPASRRAALTICSSSSAGGLCCARRRLHSHRF